MSLSHEGWKRERNLNVMKARYQQNEMVGTVRYMARCPVLGWVFLLIIFSYKLFQAITFLYNDMKVLAWKSRLLFNSHRRKLALDGSHSWVYWGQKRICVSYFPLPCTHTIWQLLKHLSISGLFLLLQVGTFNSLYAAVAGMLQGEGVMPVSVRETSDLSLPGWVEWDRGPCQNEGTVPSF